MTNNPLLNRNSIQRTLLTVYLIGVIAVIAFNTVCYAGTMIGVCGWAFIWPIYLPAMLIRIGLVEGTIAWSMVCGI